MTLEEKEKSTIKIMGFEVPRWQDCNWCGDKLACRFTTVTYDQPCDKCKDSKKYEDYLAERNKVSKNMKDADDAYKSNTVAGVFEFKGRYIYTNNRGNIIGDEPVRPIEAGDKNWKRK